MMRSGPQLTREQIRRIDEVASRDYGISSLVLMENAGANAARLLQEYTPNGPIAICCGGGNNAGDGFVIARHLLVAGLEVRIHLFIGPDAFSGDAAVNFQILQRLGVPLRDWTAPRDDPDAPPFDHEAIATELVGSEWVVDALLGTGLKGAPRDPFPEVIRAINTADAGGARIFAVDVPSGLDVDSGEPFRTPEGRYSPCVRADLTATFAADKVGFSHAASREFTGRVAVLHIGVPLQLIEGFKE